MAGDVEAVLVDPNRVGRAVHFCADIVFQSCKGLNQLRLLLNAGLIRMRNVIGQRADDGAAGRGPFLDLPFSHTEQFRHVVTHVGVLRNLWELADGEQQALRNLAAKTHGPQPEAFAHDVGLFIAR